MWFYPTWSHKNMYLCALSVRHFITLLEVRIAADQNSNIRGLSLKVNAPSSCKYVLHLNLPDSVNKCKTNIKTYLLTQPCPFNFIWSAFLNHDNTGFEPVFLVS